MKNKIKINIYLYLCVFTFFIISILSIKSSIAILPNIYNSLYLKQIMWYLVGGIFYFAIRYIKNDRIYRYSIFIYIISCVLLLYLLVFGHVANGIKGWIYIGNLSFQPSEFAKISLILILSYILNEFHFKEKTNTKEELILILKVFIISLIPAILTFLEPDTGSTITYFFIAFMMLFISGLNKKWFIIFFILISFLILSFYILYTKFSNVFINTFSSDFYYRIQRLVNWSNSSGMQLENSMIAIGTSEIKGFGFGNTPIYIPEPYSDFIFAIYANNTGIIGILSFLLLIVVFDLLIIKAANISSKTIDKYLIGGIIASLIFNQIQNLSMTIGLLPITGIPLPFISYGGSSLIVYFIMIGLSINALEIKKCLISKN